MSYRLIPHTLSNPQNNYESNESTVSAGKCPTSPALQGGEFRLVIKSMLFGRWQDIHAFLVSQRVPLIGLVSSLTSS